MIGLAQMFNELQRLAAGHRVFPDKCLFIASCRDFCRANQLSVIGRQGCVYSSEV
jgi:hypothetical protein